MKIRTSRYLSTIVTLAWIQLGAVIIKLGAANYLDQISWGVLLFPLYLIIVYTLIVLAKIIVAMAYTIEAHEKVQEMNNESATVVESDKTEREDV